MNVQKFTPEQWYAYAEAAHLLVFGEQRDPWLDRISYALLACDGDDTVGYVTCRELGDGTVYWQYGGALKEFRGIKSVRGFEAFLKFASERYKRVTTLVENDNVGYLHLLMKNGFRAIGIRYFEGKILLEMMWRTENAVH